LRSICALALAACSADRVELLRHLVDLLADRETPVRVDAVRAIAQFPGHDSELLLRLKALGGDKDPEVIGQCLVCLLEIAPAVSLPLAALFLEHANVDLRMESIAALGPCRDPEALKVLRAYWERQADPVVKRAILLALGGSPEPGAASFLVSVIKDGTEEDATTAIAALAASRFRQQIRAEVARLADQSDSPSVSKAFAKDFRD
jgi:HEAT repeat protein